MRRFFSSKIRGRSVKKEDSPAETVITPKSPEQPGLVCLNQDTPTTANADGAERYEVDIVAIHGLNGTAYGTWTHEKTSTLWLRDFLPNDIPGARILTFSYPSHLLFSKSKASTNDYAQVLLFALNRHRVGKEQRPLIFIAHSLGGIVCKQALIMAKEDPQFTSLLQSTIGVLFFGTPHRGARGTPDLGIFVGDMLQVVFNISGSRLFMGKSRTDLLEKLKANSEDLRRLTASFSFLCQDFQVVTIYETAEQIPLGRLVVDQDSAILGIPGEHRIPSFACHTEICRYPAASDHEYKMVSKEILDMCKKACYVPSLKDSEKECVKLFNDPLVTEYRSGLPERVNGTCEWILRNPQYADWVNDAQTSLLWITGHPGFGKTVLASYITEQLEARSLYAQGSFIVCYFFCNDGIESQRDASAILRSLIFQIMIERRDLVRHVKAAINDDMDKSNLLKSYNRLWSIFTNIVCDEQPGTFGVVIDALDECEKTSRNRLMTSISRLIDRLRSIGSRCVKFLVTSRPYIPVADSFIDYQPQRLVLEETQDEIDGDLRLVIAERVQRIAKRVKARKDESARLENFLNDNADRTFLWARFAFDILDEELDSSPGSFHSILPRLPQDLAAMYERFLSKILPSKQEFAVGVLRLIVASFKPLTLDEINVAMALQKAAEVECNELERLNHEYLRTNVEADINSVLGSLVRISGSKVYLVHISLKEFLCTSIHQSREEDICRQYSISMDEAHLFLATACMRYLALDKLSEDLYSSPDDKYGGSHSASPSTSKSESQVDRQCQSPARDSDDSLPIFGNLLQEPEEVDVKVNKHLGENYTFFGYSAIYWAIHFAQSQRLASSTLQDLALKLTAKNSGYLFVNWSRFLWTTESIMSIGHSHLDQLTVVSFFDHFVILEKVLKGLDIPDSKALAKGLYWAARNGSLKSVIKLLATDVDPDVEAADGQTPFCSAAEHGHLDVVKALATDVRIDINLQGKRGGSPLSFAAGGGHADIVSFLLSGEHTKHIEANIEDFEGETPLFRAIGNGHDKTTRILTADDRVDINHVNKCNETPFSWAARQGNKDVVALLLKLHTIDVNLASNARSECRTPLAFAAANGHTEVIRQLRRAGRLDVTHSHKDSKGRNALALAAWSGHDAVIKLLLRYNMPGINEQDEDQWTPLFWALESPRSSTVDTLLESGRVDVNHRDHSGRTALSWIVSYGNLEILRMLLQAPGIDPLTRDNEGLTSLDYARIKEDREHIVPILEGFLHHRR